MKLSLPIAASLAVALLTSPLHASPVTFFGENLNPGNSTVGAPVTARDEFVSNLTGVGTENFEGFTNGTGSPINLTFPGSIGGIDATLSGGGATIRSFASVGRFATSGTNYVETNAGGGFAISFSSAISAFGFFATDIGDFGGQLTLRLTPDGGGAFVDLTVPHTLGVSGSTDAALLFFGFYDLDQSYTNIAFLNSSTGDVFGFDDMIIGDRQQVTPTPTNPIPLPAAGWLMLGGMGALAALRRRRKAA